MVVNFDINDASNKNEEWVKRALEYVSNAPESLGPFSLIKNLISYSGYNNSHDNLHQKGEPLTNVHLVYHSDEFPYYVVFNLGRRSHIMMHEPETGIPFKYRYIFTDDKSNAEEDYNILMRIINEKTLLAK